MNGLRRFGLLVFALAGILCLCALALPWIGPYQREATEMMYNDYYYIAVQVVLAITALGIVVGLLRALLTPRKRKTVVVDKMGGDRITVTTAAIASQATHVIESSGRFIAERVRVNSKGKGKVSVDVRVRPRYTVDITDEGKRLHEDLAKGLSIICGEKVRHLNLEFLEATAPEPAQDVHVERLDDDPMQFDEPQQFEQPAENQIPEVPASVYERAEAMREESETAEEPVAQPAPKLTVQVETEPEDVDDVEGEAE